MIGVIASEASHVYKGRNLGPGLAEVAVTYGQLPAAAKWILCFAMLLGRLEIFTLLVLFTPMFWKR